MCVVTYDNIDTTSHQEVVDSNTTTRTIVDDAFHNAQVKALLAFETNRKQPLTKEVASAPYANQPPVFKKQKTGDETDHNAINAITQTLLDSSGELIMKENQFHEKLPQFKRDILATCRLSPPTVKSTLYVDDLLCTTYFISRIDKKNGKSEPPPHGILLEYSRRHHIKSSLAAWAYITSKFDDEYFSNPFFELRRLHLESWEPNLAANIILSTASISFQFCKPTSVKLSITMECQVSKDDYTKNLGGESSTDQAKCARNFCQKVGFDKNTSILQFSHCDHHMLEIGARKSQKKMQYCKLCLKG
jgi:hypothetical protein